MFSLILLGNYESSRVADKLFRLRAQSTPRGNILILLEFFLNEAEKSIRYLHLIIDKEPTIDWDRSVSKIYDKVV